MPKIKPDPLALTINIQTADLFLIRAKLMKIALIPPWEEKLPPAKYGGTELVVFNLGENLVKMGHDVSILTTANSRTSARIVPIFKKPIRGLPDSSDAKARDAYKIIGLAKTVEFLKNNNFDIVHNHLGWRLLPFEKTIPAPILTTLHGPLNISYQKIFYQKYKDSNYASISFNQRRPILDLNFIGNVYNGIQTEKFRFFEKPKDYFAFLGRMSPEKGPVQAIQIAKSAGVKLIMAAKVDEADKKFFDQQVQPLIDGRQIQFVGEVDHWGKVELLGRAKALIAPIQWEEPFGLFFIEAMACGTPVITLKRGSAPEIILNNATGFICANEKEMIEKISSIEKIDRQVCFQYCRQNFSSRQMAENYFNLYEKIVHPKQEPAKKLSGFFSLGKYR